jgi:hypothetical protein
VSLRKEKVSSSSGEKEASGEKETKEKSSKKKSSSSSSSTKKSSSSKTAATTSSAAAATGDVFTVKVEMRVASIKQRWRSAAQLVQLRAAKSKATRKAWAQSAPGGVSASKRDVVFKRRCHLVVSDASRAHRRRPGRLCQEALHLILYDVTAIGRCCRSSRSRRALISVRSLLPTLPPASGPTPFTSRSSPARRRRPRPTPPPTPTSPPMARRNARVSSSRSASRLSR